MFYTGSQHLHPVFDGHRNEFSEILILSEFLIGRKNIENPEAPINLIHQKDCIGIIEAIIKQECWNETFNAVAPFHPSRTAYYTQKALENNLPLPEFDQMKISIGKTILSDKLEISLDYKFKKLTL